MFAWRFVQLQARCKQKLERRRTAKEISKGKDLPKLPIRQENQIIWSALLTRWGNQCHRESTHQNAHTTNQKVDANGGARVHSCTQAKLVKKNGTGITALTSDETKEFNGVWREKDHRKELSSEDPEMIAIQTPPIHEDLHLQWTQHCEEQARVAAWELQIFFKKPRDVLEKQGYVLCYKDCYRIYLLDRNQP